MANKTIYELYKIPYSGIDGEDLLAIYNIQNNTTGRGDIQTVVDKGIEGSTKINHIDILTTYLQRQVSRLGATVSDINNAINNITTNPSTVDLGDLPSRVTGLENQVGQGVVGGTSSTKTIVDFISTAALKTNTKTIVGAINEVKAASTKNANDYQSLSTVYNALNTSVTNLNTNVTNLSSSYSTLNSSVTNLNTSYSTLSSSVTNLNPLIETVNSLVSSTISPARVEVLQTNLNNVYVKTLWTKDDYNPNSNGDNPQGYCYYLNQIIYLKDDPTTYDYIDIYYEHYFDRRVAIQRFPGNPIEGKEIYSDEAYAALPSSVKNDSNIYSQTQNRYSVRFINLMDSGDHSSKFNSGMYEINLGPAPNENITENGTTFYALKVTTAVKWRFYYTSTVSGSTKSLSSANVEFLDVVKNSSSRPYGMITKIKGIKFPNKDQ